MHLGLSHGTGHVLLLGHEAAHRLVLHCHQHLPNFRFYPFDISFVARLPSAIAVIRSGTSPSANVSPCASLSVPLASVTIPGQVAANSPSAAGLVANALAAANNRELVAAPPKPRPDIVAPAVPVAFALKPLLAVDLFPKPPKPASADIVALAVPPKGLVGPNPADAPAGLLGLGLAPNALLLAFAAFPKAPKPPAAAAGLATIVPLAGFAAANREPVAAQPPSLSFNPSFNLAKRTDSRLRPA